MLVHLCTGCLRDSMFLILLWYVFLLHLLIARSAAAFRDSPADIVERTLLLARLAVQTVGRVGRLHFIMHRLINPRRAECNTGTAELRCAFGIANIRIQNRQV